MEFHEAANIFPLDEEHLDELAEDIREYGLRMPIECLDGLILDGRRRYLACGRAGVQPRFRTVEESEIGDPVAYVCSLNLVRRHLKTGQAASCAARASELKKKLADEASQRKREAGARGGKLSGETRRGETKVGDNCHQPSRGPRTDDQLGDIFGVSGKSVERARHVHENGIPELVGALDSGKISVNKAEYISSHGPELQKELLNSELRKEQNPQKKAKPSDPSPADDPDTNPSARDSRGKGIQVAHEAINLLAQIPKNDAHRKRGFQIVEEWVQRNLRKM